MLSTNSETGTRRRDALRPLFAPLDVASSCVVRSLFVVGTDEPAVSEPKSLHSRFVGPDLLHTNVPERYELISLKVLAALQFSVKNTRSAFVLKCDDDSFVCVGGLLDFLSRVPLHGTYAGLAMRGEHRPGQRMRINYALPRTAAASQWNDVQHARMFNTSLYAPYMQGGGYVLSHDLVRAVVSEASRLLFELDVARTPVEKTPRVEDALVGALLFARPEVRFYDIVRHMHDWARAGDAAGVPLPEVCAACSGPGLLVAHPLKVAGALEACAGCADRRRKATSQPACRAHGVTNGRTRPPARYRVVVSTVNRSAPRDLSLAEVPGSATDANRPGVSWL